MNEELRIQFDDMGIEPSAEIIAKCMELCIDYHIDDAAEFVEQWLAFSASHLNGAEPTIDYLLEFERKVFQVKRDKELAAASKKKGNTKYPSALENLTHLSSITNPASYEENPLAIYGVESAEPIEDYMGEVGVGSVDDMLESSVYHTPKNAS